jgi:hypothetical protein
MRVNFVNALIIISLLCSVMGNSCGHRTRMPAPCKQPQSHKYNESDTDRLMEQPIWLNQWQEDLVVFGNAGCSQGVRNEKQEGIKPIELEVQPSTVSGVFCDVFLLICAEEGESRSGNSHATGGSTRAASITRHSDSRRKAFMRAAQGFPHYNRSP